MANMNENYTLSYAGHYEADGNAVSLSIPFAPDCVKIYNYTAYGTDGTNAECIWFKDFPAADALVKIVMDNDGGSDRQSLNLLTSGGFTDASTSGGVAATQAAISGATAANPVVVTTSAAHGFSTGDRVTITNVVGMTQLNSPSKNPYKITVLSSTTFSLQDIKGNNIDGAAFSAYVSGGSANKQGNTSFAPPTYTMTIGSTIAGSNSDEVYFECFKYGQYSDIGDQA